jgi:hypothetical protein
MGEFSILTSRRRALIALVHSIVFLLIAARQMMSASRAAGIWNPAAVATSTWILCGIYVVVSTVLLWLFAISRHWSERIYFALCAVSVSSGLLRTLVGDQAFHAGIYVRVLMLGSAVVVGIAIVRMHSGIATRGVQTEEA